MAESVKFPIEIVDKFRKPLAYFNSILGSAYKAVEKINSAGKRVSTSFSKQSRSISQLKSNIDRYRVAAEKSFRLDHIRKYNVLIAETQKKIADIERQAETCGTKTKGIFGSLQENFGISKKMIGAGAAIAILRKGIDFSVQLGKESVNAAAQVEKYGVTLKTMLGTTEKARDRMQEYFTIAKQTPFTLDQVVEGGNKLQAIGRYSRDNLSMLGDLASASGKPLEQVMSAYSKLATGQKGEGINMFRDLLISVDDWTKATGKGVSKNGELLASTEEMIQALPKIMQSKSFFGMMANQADTTEGRVSNLSDAMFQLKMSVGERLKPAYDSYLSNAIKTADVLKRHMEIPIEQKIATEKAELNLLVESLISSTGKEDERSRIIDELQRKYPDFIKNIDLEKASTEELRNALVETNTEYDKKMRKAALQRQLDTIQEDSGESMNDIVKYEMSINATKELERLHAEAKTKLSLSNGELAYLEEIGEKGRFTTRETAPLADGAYRIVSENSKVFTQQQQQDAIELLANINAQKSFQTWFGNDKKRLEKARKDYEVYKNKEKIIRELMGSDDFSNTDNTSNSGSFDNNTKTTENTRSEIEKAADVISGGGKSVKNFNITIGNIIGENTNQFQHSGENPETADGFMKKLSDAIVSIVNDVNYAG